MKDKKENSLDIFKQIIEFINQGQNFALVLVLNAEGSTPRKAGARAVVTNTGKIYGTIGGGAVESLAQNRTIESCKLKKREIFDFQLQGENRQANIPICGGRMRVLIDPITVEHKMVFNHAAEAVKQRKKGVLLTTISDTKELQVDYNWFTYDSIPSDLEFPAEEKIRSCFDSETSTLFTENLPDTSGIKEVFVEPLIPEPLLVIVGGGHISQALAKQAGLVGFDIMVLDDRSEFTKPELFPENATTITGDIAKELTKIPAEKDTYLVIVTRGHKDDAQALEVCINKPFNYIGMIGSKRKVALLGENFIQSGISTKEQFDKVFTPIGLNIGALTVPEIATSITAELIAVRRMGITHKPWKDM